MDTNTRKYPVGIQTFERIRKDGYDGKNVVKAGVQFDRDTMTVGEYLVEK